jgi:hypothetical protein
MIDDNLAVITSTRSKASDDARRDFEGFDVDEELRRFRKALRQAQWRIAAELAANLDEYLTRGGSRPQAWFGPACMREKDDLKARRNTTKAPLQDDDRALSTWHAWDPDEY